MITDLKPYEEYKETGLPWIGRVPAHWLLRRMKALFKERVEKGFPTEPLLAATQSKGVVRKDDYGARTVTAMKDLHLLKLVEKGDFVISLRSFEGGIETAHCRGIISPAYTILTPNSEVRHEYYARYFKSSDFIRSLTLFVTGIREGQNIDYEKLSRADMPIPPPDEQAAIVRFLDWACGRLDRAIRAKRKTITLLEEQKQVIIHQAVTRGLDPNVKMKPSGIDWLDDVPAHWEVKASRFLFKEVTRRNYHGDEVKLSVTQKHGIVATAEMGEKSTQARSYEAFKICEIDDLVLNKYKAHLGVFWRANQRGLITPNYTVFKSIVTLSTKYYELLYHTATYKSLFKLAVYGVTEGMMPLYTKDFYRIPSLVPPANEQIAIVDHINRECREIDKLTMEYEQSLLLLREYRTRLIADVVTGKLDVREAAAKLPDKSALATDADGYEDELADAEEPAEDGANEI